MRGKRREEKGGEKGEEEGRGGKDINLVSLQPPH